MHYLLWNVLIATLSLGEAAALLPPPQQLALGLQEKSEIDVKAAMLFHFARFCDWPERALPRESKTFTVGVMGPEDVCERIRSQIEGKPAGRRTIKVIRGATPADLGDANLIFLAQSEKNQAPELLKAFRSSPVLTVSEIPGFAKDGGIFNFHLAVADGGSKVRFELNPDAAERAGIKVTKLIKVADIVREK